MQSGTLGSALLCLVAILTAAPAQSADPVRVLRYEDGKPFQMGKVTSRRIVQPDIGAKRLTLNYSISQAGAEFSQHTHDGSDDTILVLQGQADLRQGDSRKPFRSGQCAFVPAGQIHGTITTGDGDTHMISWQTPPDLILYTGARDSSKPGAAPPKGIITPGAVQYLDFSNRNGYFTNPAMGSKHAAGAHRKLKRGERFTSEIGEAGGEQFLFVWKGAIQAKHNGQVYKAGERDTIFMSGAGRLDVEADGPGETVVIQVQAPAPAK